MGVTPGLACWSTGLPCWITTPWFNTCAAETLLGWFCTKVTPWSRRPPWSFVITRFWWVNKLPCCCPRTCPTCFGWVFNTCCNCTLTGDAAVTSVLCCRFECLTCGLTLTFNCVFCCPWAVDCVGTFWTKICFWPDCWTCWNNWGCCWTRFCADFCCDTCWSSCLITSSWTTIFCGWGACTVCVVTTWFCFRAAWSCAGVNTFCWTVCAICGCCCWLESFCWTNCWICLIWLAGKDCDWISWVAWVVGVWPLIKFKSCCAWISCEWFCFWTVPGGTWLIIARTCGVFWFDTCWRTIFCFVPTICEGDKPVCWGKMFGCFGAILLTGVVDERICCEVFGDKDFMLWKFPPTALVFIFPLESIPFNATCCPRGETLCCPVTDCFCATSGTPEFKTCLPRFPGDPIVDPVTAEDAFGVLGWMGMGFFPWNRGAVEETTGFETAILPGATDIPSTALPTLVPVFSTEWGFKKFPPLDKGTDEGTTPTVQLSGVLPLVLATLLLWTTALTNVFWAAVDGWILFTDAEEPTGNVLAFAGNAPTMLLVFNKWFPKPGIETASDVEFFESDPLSYQ